ncbi:MAG: flagellar biosynthesis anti-sigma factor FlgM [Candidatus Solibacter sp.]|nr:flagellar biosynthesis anti-sigma factor FlgM [Candidatus Solibacter sp.]
MDRTQMRIDDKNLPPPGLTQAKAVDQNVQAQKPSGDRQPGRVGQSDQVQLSSLAETVQALDANSDVSKARLDQLTKLAASGKYEPDAQYVADRMIEDSIETGRAEGPR